MEPGRLGAAAAIPTRLDASARSIAYHAGKSITDIKIAQHTLNPHQSVPVPDLTSHPLLSTLTTSPKPLSPPTFTGSPFFHVALEEVKKKAPSELRFRAKAGAGVT